MKQLGDKLRDLRESKNLRQTDVAEQTGINNKILSSYERNASIPTIENLKTICEFYNVSADSLLDIQIQVQSSSDSVMVRPDEKRLLAYYRRLNTEHKDAVRGLMVLYYKEQMREK
ncbi:MAG: helix-turn-helix domain-containing protein [Lachnospiraceae bacterium]